MSIRKYKYSYRHNSASGVNSELCNFIYDIYIYDHFSNKI